MVFQKENFKIRLKLCIREIIESVILIRLQRVWVRREETGVEAATHQSDDNIKNLQTLQVLNCNECLLCVQYLHLQDYSVQK